MEQQIIVSSIGTISAMLSTALFIMVFSGDIIGAFYKALSALRRASKNAD